LLLRVKFFGYVADITGKKWEIYNFNKESSLLDFLNTILEKKSKKNIFKFFNNKKVLNEKIKILINGRNITHLSGLETKLKNKDQISIIPISGGG
jgi:molybdopterin synthase sulfur carrier subunit